ncbi:MAG: bifunctional [glutamate--ammonia ligase]-adenylyl-L-tyrosine phosphorylase/[glutamate--ammonia-ligase] adenylyltransferase, partial [bacterium]|nr:bifunctional [glutamate--ammonia ligase]-adenylyl-L-tyrosine phosphorylase/[glutamate--ammonia-ligase] adenylyltransferase [bacterium]
MTDSTEKGLKEYEEELKVFFSRASDEEEKLESLRLFKRKMTQHLSEAERENKISLEEFLTRQTLIAEAVLKTTAVWAGQQIREKYGEFPGARFAIVGMGKLGGRELNYYSDLDVIFFYEADPKPPSKNSLSAQEYFVRVAQKVISILTTLTSQGYAYKLDAALRPSGNAGILVSSETAFRQYHEKEAQIWEKQALLKARPVAGDFDFCKTLLPFLKNLPFRSPPAVQMGSEIKRLRERMERELARENEGCLNLKTGPGGIVDIEFLTQYLQLKNGREHPDLREPNTLKALQKLKSLRLLEEKNAHFLIEGYTFCRRLESKIRFQLQSGTNRLELKAPWLPEVAGQ